MTTTNTTNKPFLIEKWRVYEAYKAVKSNQGAAGVDGQTIEAFEADLKGNLYKIWNRMSSGTYFPPPVRAVSIPKKSGGERILGVPTVSDRIAQMVVKQLIEPDLDPIFLSDSYGYRPNKSALDAVGVTRKRCWKYDWVLEFDIKGLFDNITHDLLLKAVRKHVKCKWALIYIERWLTAPMEQDDGLVHCRTEHEAEAVKTALQARLSECRLELHPTTKQGSSTARSQAAGACTRTSSLTFSGTASGPVESCVRQTERWSADSRRR